MIRLIWLDRFLAFLFLILILFVVTMGWIISSEHKLTSDFAHDTLEKSIRVTKSSTVKPYSPAPATASSDVRSMFNYVQAKQGTRNGETLNEEVLEVASSSSDDSVGYQWAATHGVTQASECDVLSSEYIDGCHNFVEVNQYVRKTEPSFSL